MTFQPFGPDDMFDVRLHVPLFCAFFDLECLMQLTSFAVNS